MTGEAEPALCRWCLGHGNVRVNVPRPTAFGVAKQAVEVPCPLCAGKGKR